MKDLYYQQKRRERRGKKEEKKEKEKEEKEEEYTEELKGRTDQRVYGEGQLDLEMFTS